MPNSPETLAVETRRSVFQLAGRWLGQAVAGSRRRAAAVVVVALLIAIGAAQYAKSIKVNTNLEALLAVNAPSVEALAELRERQGPTDLLNIAVRSSDPAANRRLVEDIHARVGQWPEVIDAFIELDYTPLRDHALYYLETEELEDLHARLDKERQRAVAAAMSVTGEAIDPENVLAGDDWDEDLDDADFDDEEADSADAADAGKADETPEDDSLRALLERQRESVAASGRIRPSDLDLIWPKEDENGQMVWEESVLKPVASPDGGIMLVRARLQQPPTNLQFATEVTDKVEALFTELDAESYAPDMLAKVGGAYASSGEAKSIITDLQSATWVSAGLVVGVLLVGFRSLRGLVVVLIPLVTSVLTTVALARLVLGELNVLTAFLFAVLLGIGVDFAVHLFAQRQRQGPRADWGEIFEHHLRPLTASMLTTMGSFLVLTLADFRGFQEFGLIAAIGVGVAFIAALVMVPALDVLLGAAPQTSDTSTAADDEGPPPALRAPKLRWALLATAIVVGAFGAPNVEFEQDMRELRAPKSTGEQGIAYQRALRATQDTGTPVVLLADSSEQLDQAVEILQTAKEREILAGTDRSWIQSVYSLATRMPPEQEAKVDVLAKIAKSAEGLRAAAPDHEYAGHLDVLTRLATAKPLAKDELPAWAKQLFEEKNGDVGNIGLLYTQVNGYDLEQVVFVTKRFTELMEAPQVRGASTRFILGDLTIAVQEDTRRLPPLALAVIALLIFIDLRKLVPSLLTFATLCAGLLLTFGVMGLWPIRINFYNLVVMPAVVGLGIDASIHLWHARRSRGVGATSRAALISALTTAGGFSGLIVSDHGGLKSIGLLGVTATLCCVVVAVVALGWPRKPTQ